MNQPDRHLAWILTGALATVAVAWIAFNLQQEGFAPAILLPLSVGGALGGIGVVMKRLTHTPSARVAVVGALAWSVLAVVGQDYLGHRRRARALEEQLAAQGPWAALAHSQVDALQPSFSNYLPGLIRRNPVWWSLDLCLTVAGNLLITVWGIRRYPARAS